MASKRITQKTFDTVVTENIEEVGGSERARDSLAIPRLG